VRPARAGGGPRRRRVRSDGPRGLRASLEGAPRAPLRRARGPPARSRRDEPELRWRSAAGRRRDGRAPRSHPGRGGHARVPAAASRFPRAHRAVLPGEGDQLPPRGHRHAGGGVRAPPAQGVAALMSFLSPLALALAGLSVPLLLLYFLKVRRREMPVSSLLLWDPALRDREASTFFQRLQRDPLLILQILALLALSLALAKPVATVMGEGSRKVVVVLDTSASMKARDVSPTRFDAARGEAVQLVRRLREGAEVMVLEAGVQPTVTAAMSRDRDRAVAAIRSARPRDLPTRLIEAVRTARALVGADPRAEIHVFTDGAFTLARSPEIDD